MGMFDLLKNTVEGVAETAINTAKTAVGTTTLVLDDGDTAKEGLDGIRKGLSKIGDSDSDIT